MRYPISYDKELIFVISVKAVVRAGRYQLLLLYSLWGFVKSALAATFVEYVGFLSSLLCFV